MTSVTRYQAHYANQAPEKNIEMIKKNHLLINLFLIVNLFGVFSIHSDAITKFNKTGDYIPHNNEKS